MDRESGYMGELGMLTLPAAAWDRARVVAAVIAPLASQGVVGGSAAEMAATTLGASLRLVYVLIRRHRWGPGLMTDLCAGLETGGVPSK